MEDTESNDVAIIGGGWSGILACKNMVENKLKTIVFEATNDMGGVFKYREEATDVGGVIWSTHTTSSKTTTEMSDFPIPHSYPNFPSHWQIQQYLNDYIDHFDIRKCFHTNRKIVNAEREKDGWLLKDANGCSFTSKYLIVCCGVHQTPDRFYLTDERFKEATVKTMHAAAYKKLTKEYFGKRILIYGGGETASDIVDELCHAATKVILSIPHGQWFVNRYSKVKISNDETFILDHFSSRLRRLLDPVDTAYYGQYVIEKQSGLCGHGIKEWENDAPYWGQFFNKCAHIIPHYTELGTLIPKGDVRKVIGNEVIFTDGSQETIDMIIFCSGYKTTFPFLQEEISSTSINERFKCIFDNEDPSLAFIGFARPVVGSIPALAELQSIYVAKIFSNKLQLPDKNTRETIIQKDKLQQDKTYSKTSKRIKGLVNFFVYSDEIAGLAGIRPHYIKLLLKSPKKWLAAILAPYNNCQFLLNDPTKHEQIFDTYKHRTPEILKKVGFISIGVIFVNLFPSFFLERKKNNVVKNAIDLLNCYLPQSFGSLLLPF